LPGAASGMDSRRPLKGTRATHAMGFTFKGRGFVSEKPMINHCVGPCSRFTPVPGGGLVSSVLEPGRSMIVALESRMGTWAGGKGAL
jgi:hypothetical protein